MMMTVSASEFIVSFHEGGQEGRERKREAELAARDNLAYVRATQL